MERISLSISLHPGLAQLASSFFSSSGTQRHAFLSQPPPVRLWILHHRRASRRWTSRGLGASFPHRCHHRVGAAEERASVRLDTRALTAPALQSNQSKLGPLNAINAT